MIVDVGFFRDEVNTAIPNVDLTNGQQHIVSVRRYNRGRRLVVAVCSIMFGLYRIAISVNNRF